MATHLVDGVIGECDVSVYRTASGKGLLLHTSNASDYDTITKDFPSKAVVSRTKAKGADLDLSDKEVEVLSMSISNKNVVAWLATNGIKLPEMEPVARVSHDSKPNPRTPPAKMTFNLEGSLEEIIVKLQQLRTVASDCKFEAKIVGR